MKSILLFTTALLFIISCKKPMVLPTEMIPCAYNETNNQHPKNTLYNEILLRYVKKGLPGISVLAQDASGTWVGSAGYADIEKKVKFTPCHLSKAASITKLMMGTLTLKLQEAGEININDPISKYIDNSILKKIEHAEGKTVRNLMEHSTGIFDVITSDKFYLSVVNNPNKQWSQLDLLEFVYGEKGIELGKPYLASYSNTNTLLLIMCIESATGIKHEQLFRERILTPLNMNDTYYQGRETLPNSTAQGYYDLHNNGTIVNMSNFITGSGNGYGGLFSNVFDLNKFITGLFIDKTILNQSSLDTMQVFIEEDEDFYTGPGTIKKFTNKSDYGIGHTGRDLGYSADLFYFPNKQCKLIFFVNYGTNGSSSLKQVFKDFESELADALLK
jgi:D-alanyl-D-alanine carboxypeptidase